MSTTEEYMERATLSSTLLILFLIFCTATAAAQNAPARKPKLVFVVILTRHGVRSPITNLEELNAFSSEPWPDWGVPSGDLTPRGRKLMELLGAYYRAYF